MLRPDPSVPVSCGTERPESAERPVVQPQAGRPFASTAQDDQLLPEQILRDHRSHAAGAAQLRGHDDRVQKGEREVLHGRVNLGQTSGTAQRRQVRESARELAIRDPQAHRAQSRAVRSSPTRSRSGKRSCTTRRPTSGNATRPQPAGTTIAHCGRQHDVDIHVIDCVRSPNRFMRRRAWCPFRPRLMPDVIGM